MTLQASRVLDSDQSNLEQVETLLRRAVESDSRHGPAYLQLGLLLEPLRRIDEAITAFAWAQRLMPKHPEPTERLNNAVDNDLVQLREHK